MSRRKIQIENILDDRNRKVCFKKRRMSLLKKALQLAKLSNCLVYMKVFNPEDFSLLELNTFDSNSVNFSSVSAESQEVHEYVKVNKENYLLIEDQITKHGHLNLKSVNFVDQDKLNFANQISTELKGFNMNSLFSLTKIK